MPTVQNTFVHLPHCFINNPRPHPINNVAPSYKMAPTDIALERLPSYATAPAVEAPDNPHPSGNTQAPGRVN